MRLDTLHHFACLQVPDDHLVILRSRDKILPTRRQSRSNTESTPPHQLVSPRGMRDSLLVNVTDVGFDSLVGLVVPQTELRVERGDKDKFRVGGEEDV